MFLLGLTAACQTRASTDAGALQQQFEREREQARPLPRRLAPDIAAASEPPSPRRGQTLAVRGFVFRGNTVIDSADLSAALEPYRQRPLDFSEMEALTAVLSAAYRARGYVASATLPAQDVSDGVLTLVVVEAVRGQLVLDAGPPVRTAVERVTGIIDRQLRQGDILRIDALERALLIASDLPGLAVSGALAEGTSPGQSDLVLSLTDKAVVSGDVALDNTGGASTGTDHLGVNLYGNSVLGQSELWSVNLSLNQGSSYSRLGLTFPVGYGGLRLGINGSHLDYRVLSSDYSRLELHGSSGVWGLEAVLPLLRTQYHNLYLSAAVDDKRFVNYSASTVASQYSSQAVVWSLYGNRYDDLAGGGATSANLALVQGHLNLDASPNRTADALSTQTAGDYRKLRFGAGRQQSVGANVTLSLQVSGQWTDQNLDSSEKFSLGGSAGVRAYPGGEALGAMGRMASAELRWRVSDAWGLSAFYDAGSITVNPRNDYSGASALNSYGLDGAGLAMVWQGDGGFTFKLTWARRLGDNPNPTSTGRDQDGTFVRDRLWASALVAF